MGKETETKERIYITIEPDALVWIDAVCERFRMNRSQVINKCVLDTQETLARLDKIGMRPERVAKMADFLVSLWSPAVNVTPGKAKA
jgi:hypothetical protein